MRIMILAIICLITLFACSPAKRNSSANSTHSLSTATLPDAVQINNLDTIWELQKQNGVSVNANYIPQLVIHFEDKKFYGNTGCNRMSGSFTIDGTSLKFDDKIISTRMACQGYNENDFINTLLKVNTYNVQDSLLELKRDTTILLVFNRK